MSQITDDIRSPEGIPAFLALDLPQDCHLCSRSAVTNAINNLRNFCEWWLAPEQQNAWSLKTVIRARQTASTPSMSGMFKIMRPGSTAEIPIFLIICQHHATKTGPHYQLQAPTGDINKISDKKLLEAIGPALERCDNLMRRYRVEKSKSIELERSLAAGDIQKMQAAISSLVSDLSILLHK